MLSCIQAQQIILNQEVFQPHPYSHQTIEEVIYLCNYMQEKKVHGYSWQDIPIDDYVIERLE